MHLWGTVTGVYRSQSCIAQANAVALNQLDIYSLADPTNVYVLRQSRVSATLNYLRGTV